MDTGLRELSFALDRLQREACAVRVFFRDDDVDDDEDSLRKLAEVFLERGIALNLAVIPGRLTRQGAALLHNYLRESPELIGLDQHGFLHVNHESEGRKCEFGPSRSFDRQRADIAEGRRMFSDEFGERISPVFVPPWNRCTPSTRRALVELGFSAISHWRGTESAASESTDALIDIPATLDPYRWKQGPQPKPEQEIFRDLVKQLEAGGVIGVMLHHKVMDAAARAMTGRLLDVLAASPAVRFYRFSDLLQQR